MRSGRRAGGEAGSARARCCVVSSLRWATKRHEDTCPASTPFRDSCAFRGDSSPSCPLRRDSGSGALTWQTAGRSRVARCHSGVFGQNQRRVRRPLDRITHGWHVLSNEGCGSVGKPRPSLRPGACHPMHSVHDRAHPLWVYDANLATAGASLVPHVPVKY